MIIFAVSIDFRKAFILSMGFTAVYVSDTQYNTFFV